MTQSGTSLDGEDAEAAESSSAAVSSVPSSELNESSMDLTSNFCFVFFFDFLDGVFVFVFVVAPEPPSLKKSLTLPDLDDDVDAEDEARRLDFFGTFSTDSSVTLAAFFAPFFFSKF